jgi:hypothetical protein
MQADGGFCASGGPYVIAHQCSSPDVRLIMIGIFGALIAAGFYAGGTAGLGSRAASAGLVLWAALFGTLGWNFAAASRHSGASGLLFTGVLFLLMAAGGLVPLLFSLAGDLRRPGPVAADVQPLVGAAVPAGPGVATTFGPAATFGPGAAVGYQPAGADWRQGMAPAGVPVRGTVTRAASRSTELLRTGVWLVVSLAGTGYGIALSSSLISMLR